MSVYVCVETGGSRGGLEEELQRTKKCDKFGDERDLSFMARSRTKREIKEVERDTTTKKK
jgi:hypothetical protein